jgi:hypothetical protein
MQPWVLPHRLGHMSSQTLSSRPQLSIRLATMATPTYPPGKTFLDTLKRSFSNVPINKEKDNAIATMEFLEAAESLTTLFGMCS